MPRKIAPAVRTVIAAMAILLAFAASPARANSDTVLTVSGLSGSRDFTRTDLESLPKWRFTTSTPWTEGATEFEGVRLSDLLQSTNVPGTKLKATALNDYSAVMEIADVREDALVAYAMNGKPMSVRTKGPLWLIFPFDAKPHLKAEQYYSRSVWQLRALAVLN